jgi:hypothetical protein
MAAHTTFNVDDLVLPSGKYKHEKAWNKPKKILKIERHPRYGVLYFVRLDPPEIYLPDALKKAIL